MESLIQSCERFDTYPQNLPQHESLLHSLKAHSDRLRSHENRLFDEKQAAVDFWDLAGGDGDEDFRPTCATTLDELKEVLRKAIRAGESDPQCRFIFIQASHSRAPLKASRAMLNFLCSYHQVIPSFLDFIYPFGKQVHAQDAYYSGLREESCLDDKRRGPKIPELGRSGKELRFCYNLRSVEPAKSQGDLPWSIRQSAMYHSFDLNTGHSLWINVKGNQLIKKRITEASTALPGYRTGSRSGAFSASLGTHLLLCDWSCENWRWYINDLEKRFHEYSAGALCVPIHAPPSPVASPSPVSMGPNRTRNFPLISQSTTVESPSSPATKWDLFSPTTPSRTTTLVGNLEDTAAAPRSCYSHKKWAEVVNIGALRRHVASLYGYIKRVDHDHVSRREKVGRQSLSTSEEMKTLPQSSDTMLVPPELPPTLAEDGDGSPRDCFSFDNLQLVQQIEDKAHDAFLVLQQNSRVFEELRGHYEYAANHAEFPSDLRSDCELDLERFYKCVLSAEKDLMMLQSRVEILLRMIANRKNLLNGILHYRSVKANEYFTKRAHVITLEMHTIAKKTEQETVSMRVITSVTLFFLPATFIATFMSAGILTFKDGGQDLQLRGLRVYLAVALPLTALTFFVWYMIYRRAKRGSRFSGRSSGDAGCSAAV